MAFKLTWYGHATLGLETGGYNIAVDPFFTGNPAAAASADDINPDFILITHGHDDHVGDTLDIARRTGAMTISNFEICTWLRNQGLTTHGQSIGGGFNHPFGYLKLTFAIHGSALPDGSYGGMPAGLLLTTKENQKVYIAGDTGLFGDMQLIGDEGIDLAVLPIGDNFTMGPDDALKAVKFLRPKHIIPIHYNTWEPIQQDVHQWAQRVQAETEAQVHTIKPGESYILE
jgi:L-ascorbate metabolism protein UlaG (beta-lactamase superfamily)